MLKLKFASAVAATVLLVSSAALATDIGVYDPLTVEAPVYGSSEVVTMIQAPGTVRAETVAPVEAIDAATPIEGQTLDMSGADGTLRACYTAGGMAKQRQDLSYYCTYDVASSEPATNSDYVVAPGVDTGYNGTDDIANEALMDCVQRGGTLIQLASNEKFACAM